MPGDISWGGIPAPWINPTAPSTPPVTIVPLNVPPQHGQWVRPRCECHDCTQARVRERGGFA